MTYEADVVRKANAELERRRKEHEKQQEQLRQDVYEACPRLKEIDRKLRSTVAEVAAVALKQGTDPGPRLRAIRGLNMELQEERRQELLSLGYPEDVLDDKPYCKLCKDRGWRGAEMCSCLAALCAQEQVRKLSAVLPLGEASFESFQMDYYSEQISPDTGTSPRENMELVYEVCSEYARKFPGFRFKNLILTGGTGLGKTFLSACIARTVAENGFSVVYDTAVSVFANYEAQRFHPDEKTEEAMRKYRESDLLILDDLGSEMTTNMVQMALYTLINDRLTAGKHTIISTNLSTDDLRARYTPQIVSRLLGEYQTMLFFGEDIRILKKQGEF